MKIKAVVYITLKESVLDPQGSAVEQSLHAMDYQDVEEIRVGKYLEVVLQANTLDQARDRVAEMCDKLLANPVIEDYKIEIVEG